MSPALFVTFSRLLCAGLCCIALSVQANSPEQPATQLQPAAQLQPATQLQPAAPAQPTHVDESASAQEPVAQSSSQADSPPASQPASQSVPASAQTLTATTSTPVPLSATPIGGGRHMVSVVLALLGIIALIFALSWFVKRFGQGGFAQNQHMKILSTMPLGTRERIVLIDAGGQQILLGITATAINTLHVFSEPIVVPENEERSSDFSRKLMAILQQKTAGAAGGQNNNNDDSATR